MKNKSIWQSILLSTIAITPLVFGSCQDEVEMPSVNQATTGTDEFVYSYPMQLNLTEDDQTRAVSFNWKEGDVLYMSFNTSYGTILGKATYSANSDNWTLSTDAEINDSEGYIGLAFVDGGPSENATAEDDHWVINLSQDRASYSNQWCRYYMSDNGIIVSATLNKRNDRVRFEGTPGTKISFTDQYGDRNYWHNSQIHVTYHNVYNSENSSFEDVTVQEDGFTPYIYMGVSGDSTSMMFIQVDNGEIYGRRFYYEMLSNSSRSATIKLPTTQSANGWGIMQTIDDMTYLLDSNTKTAIPYRFGGDPSVTEINIPASIYHKRIDYTITALGAYIFADNEQITKVTIPEGVTTIGYGCFRNCYALEEVNLPSTLKSIGDECFANDNLLKNITLPEGLMQLGRRAFSGSGIQSINLPSLLKRIENETFWCCYSLSEIIWGEAPELEYIDSYAFGNTSISQIELPEGVQTIEYCAFYYDNMLEKVSIPSTVTYISSDVFYGSSNLSTIEIKSTSLPRTYSSAFESCYGATLYVHGALLDKYKTTEPWSNFADIQPIAGTENATISNGKAVDLGLPSGTLWADRNVGAYTIESRGDYFAWGETTTKTDFSWENYKFYDYESGGYVTKYITDEGSPYYDNLTELQAEDDAATANWGSDWKMPTTQQMRELLDACRWEWKKQNGFYGYLITGPNGKTLFLPEEGRSYNDHNSDYWTSHGWDSWAEYLYFRDQDNYWISNSSKCDRRLIRPVKK